MMVVALQQEVGEMVMIPSVAVSPQVYIDIAKLISDLLQHRYVGTTEAEQLFDAIACGLEACSVPLREAELIRSQLRDSTGREDG